jgi:sec-independent protein translocase protein TatC
VSEDEKRMTFTEHLAELRTRLIHSIYAFAICAVFCYAISTPLLSVVMHPLVSAKTAHKIDITVLNPMEPILLKFKMAGYFGLAVAFPYILWQLCAFVFPGLLPSERRIAKILIFGCGGLAVVGVFLAYALLLPLVMPVLLDMVPEGWVTQLRANETITIIFNFLMGFAIAFQFPMAVLILVYLDLLSPQTLKDYRRMAIVGMAVIAAVLTPPDYISMMIMLIPLLLLYESSILLSYLVIKRKKTKEIV